jgi:type I restriction enzyme S subunit
MSREKEILPELRFPVFVNDGEWEEKAISQIGDTVNGLTGKKGEDFGSGKPYVQYKQVFDKSFIVFSECGKVSIGDDENQNELQKGDILFTTSSETPNEVGFASVLLKQPNEPTYLNSFCFILRPFNLDKLKPNFSRYLFHSPIYRKSVNTIAQGAIRYNLSKGAFLDLRLPVPKPKEQQKIASCLSSLDELIATHSDKLEALKDHKKGLMQNLFPQEGQNVPNYRFPEFEKDGEWVETKLGEAADFINGRAYKQDELLSKGKYRVLRVGNFFTNNEWYYSDLELDEDKYCESGDLLYAWSASFGPHIWKEEKVIYHYHIWKVKNKEGINRQFFYNLLDCETLRMKSKTLNGFALLHITKGAIENWDSIIPKSEKEQQKIASCLTALDELINAQSEKIEQLQQHKKGLMQGLFPKIND